jgi:multidrug efflux pump
VRIRDVGNAEVGPVEERVISRFNGKPSLNIGVIKQAVANPLELSQAVRAEVVEMNEALPPEHEARGGVRHLCVHRSLDRERLPLDQRGDRPVVLVIFLFLRSLRATVIPLVTIPYRWSAHSRSCTCSGSRSTR